jgi:phospholipid/cholesterol/gamma-HCH transport system ATP-binding protein
VIRLEDVHLRFGDTPVLRGIGFSVARGERASLVGPGGCGKTTALKVLLGLIEPVVGEVSLGGTDMLRASDAEKRAVLRRVGMAFQQGALFDFMTVAENLRFAMENMTDFDRVRQAEKIRDVLAGVKLGKSADSFPFELSGGMQRRVGIARALAVEPEVAIFDEPTAGLDPVTSTVILNMILALARGADSTLLVATSNVEIAIRFADRVILVNDGAVVADGPWRDLIVNGSDWVRHFLGVRLIGLDPEYALTLDLPDAFVRQHWGSLRK